MPDDNPTRCFGSPDDPLMMSYHDNEWGIPVHDDRKQFEFLCLESMQSGLSWKTILDKRENFRNAFANFDPDKVAAYTDADIERLMGPTQESSATGARSRPSSTTPDASLRSRRNSVPSPNYIWQFTGHETLRRDYEQVPAQTPESEALVQGPKEARGFKFMGPIVVYSHMQATGQVNDHHPTCFRAPLKWPHGTVIMTGPPFPVTITGDLAYAKFAHIPSPRHSRSAYRNQSGGAGSSYPET